MSFNSHAGGTSLFLWLVFWASIRFEFTYVKWNNREMGFANVRSGNIVRSSNHRWNYKIKNSDTDVAYCCISATTTKWDQVSLFLESNKKFLIHLHSSTFVCTRLLTRLHSSTFVYIRLWLVYIRLHWSTLVCVFRIDQYVWCDSLLTRLCRHKFWN